MGPLVANDHMVQINTLLEEKQRTFSVLDFP